MIRRSRSVVSSCCSACRALITIRVCAISGSAGCYVGAVRRSESRQHRCRLPPWPGAPFRQRWPAPPRRRVARGVQKWSAKVRSAECGVPRQRFVCLRERDGARGGRGGGGTRWRPRLYSDAKSCAFAFWVYSHRGRIAFGGGQRPADSRRRPRARAGLHGHNMDLEPVDI